jgi:hypothetical protein
MVVAADTAHTEHETVGVGMARSADVRLRIGAGQLQVAGGARALMDARFSYDGADRKPQVSYAVQAQRGWLTVQQPATDDFANPTDARNDWHVLLNSHVPLHLGIEAGAAASTLSLGNLFLTGLDVKLGVGTSDIDLAGRWSHSFAASIRGGIGALTVRLPRQVGVHVTVKTGIGEVDAPGLRHDNGVYVNDAYGSSPITVDVTIENGIGHVTLEQAS